MSDGVKGIKNHYLSKVLSLPATKLSEKLRRYYGTLQSNGNTAKKQFVGHCHFCLLKFNNKNCSVTVEPAHRNGPRFRRILKKISKGQTLAPIEKKLAFRASTGNSIVYKCLSCKKKSVTKTRKPRMIAQDSFSELKLPKKKKRKGKLKLPPIDSPKNEDLIVLDETTVIENLSKWKKRKRQKMSGNSSGTTIGSPNSSMVFLPLQASTPMVSKSLNKKPASSSKVVNRSTHCIQNAVDNQRKKRLSKLQKLLQEDDAKKNSKNPLREFLSGL